MNICDISQLHQMLIHRRKDPGPLDVTVTKHAEPEERHLPRLATVRARGTKADIMFYLQPQRTVQLLLANYPTPAVVNDVEVKRQPRPAGPAVYRVDDEKQHPEHRVRINPDDGEEDAWQPKTLSVDGLSYSPRASRGMLEETLHFPDPRPGDGLYHRTAKFEVRYNLSLSTNAASRRSIQFTAESDVPTVTLDAAMIEEAHRQRAEQRDMALDMIREFTGKPDAEPVEPFINQSNTQILPAPGVTPVTIGYSTTKRNRSPHTIWVSPGPRRPIEHSVLRHLNRHPELMLLAVRTPRPDPEAPHDLTIPNVEATSVILTHQDGTQAEEPLGREAVREIVINVVVEHPDGSRDHLTLDADTAMVGDFNNQRPTATSDFDGSAEDLGKLIEQAYGNDFSYTSEDIDRLVADHRRKCLITAVDILHGKEAAYRRDLYEQWKQFHPMLDKPADLDLPTAIAEIITAEG